MTNSLALLLLIINILFSEHFNVPLLHNVCQVPRMAKTLIQYLLFIAGIFYVGCFVLAILAMLFAHFVMSIAAMARGKASPPQFLKSVSRPVTLRSFSMSFPEI